MKEKAAKIFSSSKYGICVFVLLIVQAAVNLFYPSYGGIGEYNRLYYLVDFSMGKTSRLLLGSIVSLLNDSPSVAWLNGFATVILLIAIILASVLIGKVINQTKNELKPQVLIAALFFVSGSFTMHSFSAFFGYIDVNMFIVSLVAIFFMFNKYLRWLVPVLCVAGVFYHNAFAATYFPVIALIWLYLVVTEEKKKANIIILTLSILTVVAATLYCVLWGADTMTLTYEEFCERVLSKSPDKDIDFGLEFLGFYFYNVTPEEAGFTVEQVSEMSFFELLFNLSNYILSTGVSANRLISLLIAPPAVIAVFWAIWIKCMKNTDSKAKKFVYLCFLLASLLIAALCLVANDYVRWVQTGIITQFGLVFAMFYTKDEPFETTMKQFRTFFSNKKLVIVLSYVLYVFIYYRDQQT